MTKLEDVNLWAEMRFKNKIKKDKLNHPIISTIREKSDEKYLELFSKYINKDTSPYSIRHFKGITRRDIFLYKIEQFYNNVKYALFKKRLTLKRFVIMSNIKIENQLNISRNKTVLFNQKSKINFIKQKMIAGFKLLAQIKPSQKNTEAIIYRHYPQNSMIYSTFIANCYAMMKYKSKCSGFSLFAFPFCAICFAYLNKWKRKAIKDYNDNYIKMKNAVADIVNHPYKYKKIEHIFSKEDDDYFMNFLNQLYNQGEREFHPFLDLFCITSTLITLIVSLYKKKTRNIKIIPKVLFSYLISKELSQYGKLIQKLNPVQTEQQKKIDFFKQNFQHVYIKH